MGIGVVVMVIARRMRVVVGMGMAVIVGLTEGDDRQGVAVDQGVAVVVRVRMRMVVAVVMCRERGPGQIVELAEGLVAAGAVAIAAAGAILEAAADAFDMVVVAFLREANLGLKAQHLLAIFAHGAVHQVLADQHFLDAVDEGVDDQRVVVEIGRLEDLDAGELRLGLVGGVVDAFDQDAGEEEIGEDDDAAIAEPRGMIERRGDEREGDAGKGDLGPAEAHTLPEEAHDLGDVGIGIGVGGAAANDEQ